jgi:hypothetical protein
MGKAWQTWWRPAQIWRVHWLRQKTLQVRTRMLRVVMRRAVHERLAVRQREKCSFGAAEEEPRKGSEWARTRRTTF